MNAYIIGEMGVASVIIIAALSRTVRSDLSAAPKWTVIETTLGLVLVGILVRKQGGWTKLADFAIPSLFLFVPLLA